MPTQMKFLKPNVTTNMDIIGLVSITITLRTHPLFNHTTMKDNRFRISIHMLIFKLRHPEESGIRHLKPIKGIHDTEIISTSTTCRLLSHAKTYDVQKVNSHRMD